jgi:hypothetical protein
LAIQQFSTPKPSLSHLAPHSFVASVARQLGHELAFSGESHEFLRSIHLPAFLLCAWIIVLKRGLIVRTRHS